MDFFYSVFHQKYMQFVYVCSAEPILNENSNHQKYRVLVVSTFHFVMPCCLVVEGLILDTFLTMKKVKQIAGLFGTIKIYIGTYYIKIQVNISFVLPNGKLIKNLKTCHYFKSSRREKLQLFLQKFCEINFLVLNSSDSCFHEIFLKCFSYFSTQCKLYCTFAKIEFFSGVCMLSSLKYEVQFQKIYGSFIPKWNL